MRPLSAKQQEALTKFPIGVWVRGMDSAIGIHISVLRSLIQRGLLEHKPADGIPAILSSSRTTKIWVQNLKMGNFLRKNN